jgi:hypothetical protein
LARRTIVAAGRSTGGGFPVAYQVKVTVDGWQVLEQWLDERDNALRAARGRLSDCDRRTAPRPR